MSWYTTIIEWLFGPPRLRCVIRPNRVDAFPHHLRYHDPSTGPKPRHPRTTHLPLRTPIRRSYLLQHNLFYDVTMAQTHAYYEEIDTIPATVMNAHSFFERTGHWYVIHPVDRMEMREWKVVVLWELKKWIEESRNCFMGEAEQILEFREKRMETLNNIRKELDRKGITSVGNEEGFLGVWEEIGREDTGERNDKAGEDVVEVGMPIEEDPYTIRSRLGSSVPKWLAEHERLERLAKEALKESNKVHDTT